MRFPRTIRLDETDVRVFERAAEPGEWAVPGAFAFADLDPAGLTGKLRQAFVHGFLGTSSFGRSTLVEIAEIDETAYHEVTQRLALHFIADYGAPDLAAALPAAREEAAFAAGLCEHGLHTLIAVERELGDDGIVERFRVIEPARATDHAKIWSIIEEN
ncbi:MAG: DUF6505 family protein [Alphaproteobacteria bacterium]